MALTPKVLAFAGSTREASFNKKLARVAADAARKAGAEVTFLDLRDLNLPMFDEDLEKEVTLPAGAQRLKEAMRAHHGFIIACPEYNSSITAVLKNAIDWASRPEPNEPPLSCFNDKVCLLLSASPGALGGLRGLVHTRAILSSINALVLPDQLALIKAAEAFDADHKLVDPKQQATLERMTAKLVSLIAKLRS